MQLMVAKYSTQYQHVPLTQTNNKGMMRIEHLTEEVSERVYQVDPFGNDTHAIDNYNKVCLRSRHITHTTISQQRYSIQFD
jgi:predicted acylesterase/phospholipase RssA